MKRPFFLAAAFFATSAVPTAGAAAGNGRATCQRPDDRLYFASVPNCSATPIYGAAGTLTNSNSLGLWAPEPSPVPANTLRVLFVGSGGLLTPEDGDVSATSVFASRFRPARGGLKVEAINGSTLPHALPQIRLELPELVKKYRPKVVVLLTVPNNDLPTTFFFDQIATARDENGFAAFFGPARYFWPFPRFLEPWLWNQNWAKGMVRDFMVLREMYLLLRAKIGGDLQLAKLYAKYLVAIRDACAKEGSELVVVDIAAPGVERRVQLRFLSHNFSSAYLTQFDYDTFDAAFDPAREAGVHVVSLQDVFSGIFYNDPSYRLLDGRLVPNSEGMRFLGETLAQALAREPAFQPGKKPAKPAPERR